MSIAFHEFSAAVKQLAGAGNRKQRLLSACSPSLVGLPRKELPDEIRGVYDSFTSRLGTFPRPRAADLRNVIGSADDAMIDELVDSILLIHDALARYQPTWANLGRQGCRR